MTIVQGNQELSPDTATADRRLLLGGVASIGLIVLSVVLRLTGVLPSGWATVLILVVAAIGLRVFVGYAARSATSGHAARMTRLISLAGLAVSVVTVLVALPVLLRTGGSDTFVSDVLAHLWTILILLLIVGRARTLGWQTLLGMGLTAFLAVAGLAGVVGRQFISALGEDSTFAPVVLIPAAEELLKALPALVVLLFAARNRSRRPSAVEMALLGACLGAGFALYEDTQFGRGGFEFGQMPLMSLVNPVAFSNGDVGVTYACAGHMVFTALLVLGLAVAVLYRRQLWWAKLAAPVCFAVVAAEHMAQNYVSIIAAGGGNETAFNLVRVLTLWGWLSSLLLMAGLVWFARLERKLVAGDQRVPLQQTVASSLRLRPAAAARAATALATAQLRAPHTQEGAR